MARLYVGLLHYPVRDRKGQVVASALTALDLSDIARSARTYDISRYYVITPLQSQQQIALRLLDFWLGARGPDHTHRREALQLVRVVATLQESLVDVLSEEGLKPLLVGTSARLLRGPHLSYAQLRERIERDRTPVYVLFGTGWGIADELLARLDYVLPPLYGPGEYNHLSVRAAAAIILDRLRRRCEE